MPLTRFAIPEGEALLLGGLTMHKRGPESGRPMLQIAANCPYCRTGPHFAPVSDLFALDVAVEIPAPCSKGPLVGRRIYLAIDDARMTDARRMARHHVQSLRRYLIERRLRFQLVAERAVDRSHARAGWVEAPGRYRFPDQLDH